MYQYDIVRSRRKTLALHITGDSRLEVRAPLALPAAEIDRFVASKEKWIRKNLEEIAGHSAARSAFTLDYGSMVLLFGKEYPITPGHGRSAGFDRSGVYIPPGLGSADIKRLIVNLYRVIAKAVLVEKTGDYARSMGLMPSGIKITGAKTRWGSCSGKNSICFSWRLIMADEEVIDYVLVHELAHIKEHNHSHRFWAIVEGVLPDYSARKKKLKQLQTRLASEDWDG